MNLFIPSFPDVNLAKLLFQLIEVILAGADLGPVVNEAKLK
jgi:hypothetical protein